MIKSNISFELITFPNGEKSVRLPSFMFDFIQITWCFEDAGEILTLALLADAFQRAGKKVELSVPYFPFSRQDRVVNAGESLSVKVMADMINAMGFKSVTITDPHSDVTPALINNCIVVEQYKVFRDLLATRKDFCLICPDAGAAKKIHKLAEEFNPIPVVYCAKYRDTKTGEVYVRVPSCEEVSGKNTYIVDDICDGGATFIEIAKQLKNFSPKSINLCVTHGFFTKGLGVFDGLIDNIYTLEGKVK